MTWECITCRVEDNKMETDINKYIVIRKDSRPINKEGLLKEKLIIECPMCGTHGAIDESNNNEFSEFIIREKLTLETKGGK